MRKVVIILCTVLLIGVVLTVRKHMDFVHHWDQGELSVGHPDLCLECHIDE